MSRSAAPSASTPPMKGKVGSAASGMANISSPQMANLLNKTAAAAEEFKRLLTAEQQWAEEKTNLQQEIAKLQGDLGKQATKTKRLEELRANEVASWRKDREAFIRDKEAAATKITSLMRELDLKAQAEARFGQERKSWAERVDRIEKIAADAKEDAKSAGEEVSRLQSAYQELFAKSRQEKDSLSREMQLSNEENADLRQSLSSVQEQHKATVAQVEALDRVVQEYRRTISQLGQEKEDLLKQQAALQNEAADAFQQLNAAEEALEVEKEAHAAALEVERTERQRQQQFFDQALSEAEAEARGAASQLHGVRMKLVQLERENKRIREERVNLQDKIKGMEDDIGKERLEWEQTYQQLTGAIAAKEMEQDAAAAHLEVMLRSVVGGAPPPTDSGVLRGEESPLVAPSSTEVSDSIQLSIAPSDQTAHRERSAASPPQSYQTYPPQDSPPERGLSAERVDERGLTSSQLVSSIAPSVPPSFHKHSAFLYPANPPPAQRQQHPALPPSSAQRPPAYQSHPGDRYDSEDHSQSPPDRPDVMSSYSDRPEPMPSYPPSYPDRPEPMSSYPPSYADRPDAMSSYGQPSYGGPSSMPSSLSMDPDTRTDHSKSSSRAMPRYMQEKSRDKTGATVSEVANSWDRGLRGRDPSLTPSSGGGRKSAWH